MRTLTDIHDIDRHLARVLPEILSTEHIPLADKVYLAKITSADGATVWYLFEGDIDDCELYGATYENGIETAHGALALGDVVHLGCTLDLDWAL